MTNPNMQEVNVDHVNAMLAALSDQRNAALNTVAQVQADNVLLRKQVEELSAQNQNLTNALAEQVEKSAKKDVAKAA